METTPSSAAALPEGATITPEKAEFIERSTGAYFAYTLECYDQAKTDGNNVLQWLFGVIAGGIGLIGPLVAVQQWWLAIAFGIVIARAAWIAMALVPRLASQETQPPGNFAESLNQMLDDTAARMRWREAWSQDERIRKNAGAVERIALAVDAARTAFAQLPFWFLPPAIIGAIVQFLHP